MNTEKFPITIYHNPACGTSRKTVDLLKSKGYDPYVIEYLKSGWTLDLLNRLLAQMGAAPKDILRVNGTNAEALGLTAPDANPEMILSAMVADPILVNRPIVETPRGVKLCRPQETVLDLLPG